MCVKQVLQWVGIIPKAPKTPQAVAQPTAPPVSHMARQAAATADAERLQDDNETGKDKLKTKKKQRGFQDPREALKSLGGQKAVTPSETTPTAPEGGISTPGVTG